MHDRVRALFELIGFIISFSISVAGFVFLTTYTVSILAASAAALFITLLAKTHPQLIRRIAAKLDQDIRDKYNSKK